MVTDDGRPRIRIASLDLPALPTGLGEALWLFVLLRVGLGAVALFVWAHVSIPQPCHFEVARDGWLTVPPLASSWPEFPFVGLWQRWDACWYSKIATFGYETGADSVAFFPLLPALMHVAAIPFGGDVAIGGLIVSGGAYVLGITGLIRLVTRDFDIAVARRTALFISVAPGALFLFAPFTEALFLALTVWAILAARERRWWLATAVALLAGLTRIQGLLLALPLAWEAWCAWRDRHAEGLRWLPNLGSIAATVAPVIGVAAFVIATSVLVGKTPLDAQDAWGGRNFHPPWEVVDASLHWVFDHGDAIEAINLIVLVGFALLIVQGVGRVPHSYTLLAASQVAILAVRIQPTPLTSTTRLLEVAFPVFVVVALETGSRRREVSWLLLSVLVLGMLTWTFVIGDFVA
jgi:hypothetical protein